MRRELIGIQNIRQKAAFGNNQLSCLSPTRDLEGPKKLCRAGRYSVTPCRVNIIRRTSFSESSHLFVPAGSAPGGDGRCAPIARCPVVAEHGGANVCWRVVELYTLP